MTIRKQLYSGFGAVLAMLMLLLLVNVFAGLKEKSARADALTALDGVRTIESVRYQIMLNRLDLNNFLLSGDPRDEERVNKGLATVSDLIKRGEAQSSTEILRSGMMQVETTEASWADNFAKPLLAKRHQVDSGDATVSDLQIFYLQKDPSSWLTKSAVLLDQSAVEISKNSDESAKSAARASYPFNLRDRWRNAACLAFRRHRRFLYRALHYRATHAPHHRDAGNRRLRRPRSKYRHSPQRRNRRLSYHV